MIGLLPITLYHPFCWLSKIESLRHFLPDQQVDSLGRICSCSMELTSVKVTCVEITSVELASVELISWRK